MNPSGAMGTFLRVWRSGWAGLSRAQLAIAVNAHCPERRKVTTGVVRWWESGQPPGTTEELEALCLVMRRHALTAWEVEDFRRAVFAACSSRQYPELFPDEDFAYRDGIGEACWSLRCEIASLRRWVSGVQIVAWDHELQRAVSDRRSRVGPAQDEQQRLALLHVRQMLATRHQQQGRTTALGRTVGWIEAYLHQERECLPSRALFLSAIDCAWPLFGAIVPRGDPKRVRAQMERMGRVASEAEAKGLAYQSSFLRMQSLDAVSVLPEDERRHLIAEAEQHVERGVAEQWWWLDGPLCHLIDAHLDGRSPDLARAERYVDALQNHVGADPPPGPSRLAVMGVMCHWSLARNDPGGAQDWAERLLAAAQAYGVHEGHALELLAACERAQHANRHRKAKARKVTRPAAK